LQLLTKDFYHTSSSAFEVKDTTPNNVAFKVTGKSTHEGATSGLVCFNGSSCYRRKH
jgi:voltage-dependent anion channel protein 2